MDSLPVPTSVKSDLDATEIVRAFLQNDELHMSLNIGLWEEPTAWGIVLGDMVRHLANAYHQSAGIDRNETIRQIGLVFISEMQMPEGGSQGNFVDDGDTRTD